MHTFIPGARTDLVFICDHASNHVPDGLHGLGLPTEELSRHIAWDIGAEVVARTLAARFGAPALVAGVSRLVIDLNREPDHPGLIPLVSDGTRVPGNADTGQGSAERERRRRLYYEPYHAALGRWLDARLEAGDRPFVVSVHSFTPHPETGSPRALDVGLLALRDEDGGDWRSATAFLDGLPARLTTAINEPYSAYDLNHTMDHHVVPRRLRHLGIEIRQDHLGSDDTARAFAATLAPSLEAVFATTLPETPHAAH